MKNWQSASVMAAVAMVGVFAACPAFKLRAQPRLTVAQIAALQPAPPSLIPRFGTFWLLSRTNYPPNPCDPYPDLPVYRLPDGSWLVDDSTVPPRPARPANVLAAARSFLTQPNVTSQQGLASSMESEAEIPGLPNPTNTPPQNNPSPPQLVPTNSIPTHGTFWSLSRTNWPPWPCDPCPGCAVWALSDGSYLVDDTGYVWPQPSGNSGGGDQGPHEPLYSSTDFWVEILGVTNGMANLILHGTASGVAYTIMSRQSFAPADPWDAEQPLTGADGQNWTPAQVPTFGRPVLFFRALLGTATPQRLWLCAVGISNNCFNCVLHGTSEDTSYDLRSTPSLGSVNTWAVETNFPGASGQYWTPVSIPLSGRPSLFLSARSWVSSNGSGIPDWWLLQYLGRTDIDPYALCPSGDGWSIFDAYQNGWNPNLFYTPPAPSDFVVSLNQSTWTATLSWQPSGGAITGYTVSRLEYYATTDTQDFQLGVTNQFVDWSFPPYTNILNGTSAYALVAHYVQGDSATAYSPLLPGGDFSVYTVSGPPDTTMIHVTDVPTDASGLRLTEIDWTSWGYPFGFVATNFTFALNDFTNGFLTLPQDWTVPGPDGSAYYAQAVWPDGSVGQAVFAGTPAPAFYDGRLQLAQNLAFVLRAASVTGPLYYLLAGEYGGPPTPVPFPASYAFASPTAGGRNGSSLGSSWGTDYTRAFEDNWFYRNFVFDSTNLGYSAGELLTGITWDDVNGDVVNPATMEYAFQMPANGVFPGFLSAAETPWILPHSDPALLDLYSTTNLFTVQNGVSNWYGLRLLSAEFTSQGPSFMTLYPGQSAGRTNSYFFANFDQPSLSTVGYVFGGYNNDGSWSRQGPLPGDAQFCPTSPPPLLVASLGISYQVVAYAQQTIVNGDSTKPAYLGQYFESAFQVDTNGVVTTNPAGTLSPCGVFVPTQPGAAALVTMTNWGVNERGTGFVYTVALCTDVNRDGVIDPTVYGPDYTSQDHPFRFWINDNHDFGEDGGDGVPTQPGTDADAQNYSYVDANTGTAYYNVHGVRDLIDFFPVYVNIRSLLQAVPSTSTLTFKLREGTSSLRFLYTDLTPDNYMSYLTDTNVARSLASADAYTITWDGVPLATNFLAKIRDQGAGIILVEASQRISYSGDPAPGWPMFLEVWQGSNMLAQASLYLSITGVEQMFRHKNLMLNQTPADPRAPAERLSDDDVPNEPDTNDKNFVFLHGYNINPYQARGVFADVFKRLYWSGSHAKFWGVTWDGYESQWARLGVTPNYHTNVANAFLTAPLLANFLGTLTNGPTVVAAHSLGNMVVLSALSDWNAPIGQYFMIDAALAVEALDETADLVPDMIHPEWTDYTNRLYASRWFSLFAGDDGRNVLSWSGRLANLGSVDVYNFYSSGEEVLRIFPGTPPDVPVAMFDQTVLDSLFAINPRGTFSWVWQEKMKGRCVGNWILGSTHGGWGWNQYNDQYYWHTNAPDGGMEVVQLDPVLAALLPADQLRTNAFFDMSVDTAMFTTSPSGSTYAQANRNRILSDAIPALTLPVGANAVTNLDQPNKPYNFDMQVLYENGWPLDRGAPSWPANTTAPGEWHHSDFCQVAYTFTYPLFNQMVTLGNLK